jgi:hypothetical protein
VKLSWALWIGLLLILIGSLAVGYYVGIRGGDGVW